MTGLQIGAGDAGLRRRSLRGRIVGAAKTMVEELEAQKPFVALFDSNTNEGFKGAFEIRDRAFQSAKGPHTCG